MLRDVRCGADQRLLGDTADFDDIIRDEPVSSFNELQCRLRFADAALAGDENTFAVDINEHSVDGDHRSKTDIQPADNFGHERRGRLFGHENRALVFVCIFEKCFIRMEFAAEDHAGCTHPEEFVIDLLLALLRHLLHVGIFHESDDLNAVRIVVIKVAGEKNSRTVHIRLCDFDPRDIDVRCQIFQFFLLNNLA